ncbi:hypothetical protein RhiirC2_795471 [Rhizophagus irregularis]|uniref:SAM domain-containing protein n=1 Tax=Rhizophagus irregularis TaxID=588596 RepID=A0A2N1MBJ3_9GLOM|nr:hypothetical protein RhiirC2_795471 [Rhizophagus irregularis]
MSTSTAEYDSCLVENWDTETLIDFLKEQNLKLDDKKHYDVLRNEEITGLSFLDMTEEKLRSYGFKGGPATLLAKEAKTLKEKLKRAFSSYRSLKEVLAKYGIDGNGIGTIRRFPPATYKLEDDDEELVQCIKEIKHRLGNMGTMLADSNEAMRCEYISAILHASLYIVKRITKKELTLAPQLEVVGEGSTGRVDYATKALEELICITEGKLHQVVMGFAQNLIQCESALQFILFASDGISCTSKNPLNIRFSEFALKEGLEEEKELHKNVKRVMEVIVGLLKDGVDVEKEPAMKKQRVKGYFEKE